MTSSRSRLGLRPCDMLILPADQFDEQLWDNRKVVLRHIADELRVRLPQDAMLPCESTAYSKVL